VNFLDKMKDRVKGLNDFCLFFVFWGDRLWRSLFSHQSTIYKNVLTSHSSHLLKPMVQFFYFLGWWKNNSSDLLSHMWSIGPMKNALVKSVFYEIIMFSVQTLIKGEMHSWNIISAATTFNFIHFTKGLLKT
jgi:hypothetical protein